MVTRVPAPKKRREAPPPLDAPVRNLERKPPTDLETLNFKVSEEFKREYKGYAVSHGLNMLDLLRESFDLYREKYGR